MIEEPVIKVRAAWLFFPCPNTGVRQRTLKIACLRSVSDLNAT